MQTWQITITTSVDGVETQITRKGEVEVAPSLVRVCYREENCVVSLFLEEEQAKMQRQGDYQLSLHLKTNERTTGRLGIGGSQGEILVDTHKINYTAGKNSVLIALHYDLIIGGEKQEMRLKIQAKTV